MNHGSPLTKRLQFSTVHQLNDSNAPPPPELTIAFDDPDPDLHDVVLIVQTKKFYCSKIVLAKMSPYFHRLFFSNSSEKNKKEIVLEDPQTSEDFQAFLELAHGSNSLNDANIEAVTHLAHIWEHHLAEIRCIHFLKEESELPLRDKFRIAEKYGYELLKDRVLEKTGNCHDLQALIPNDPMELSHFTVCQLLKKSLYFNDLHSEKRRSSLKPVLTFAFHSRDEVAIDEASIGDHDNLP